VAPFENTGEEPVLLGVRDASAQVAHLVRIGRREKIRGDKVEATRFGGKFREMAKNNGVTMT
jgi:hypothetical protein